MQKTDIEWTEGEKQGAADFLYAYGEMALVDVVRNLAQNIADLEEEFNRMVDEFAKTDTGRSRIRDQDLGTIGNICGLKLLEGALLAALMTQAVDARLAPSEMVQLIAAIPTSRQMSRTSEEMTRWLST